jgi:hypothetical protein
MLNMEKHSELTDQQFELQFETTTLAPSLFCHEAHLRLAWIHIKKYGVEKAIDNVSAQIMSFANHHGDSKKFNVTVTVAAVRAVYHFILKSQSSHFKDFIKENPRLKTSFKDLIKSHYSGDIFSSHLAREIFLEPDLLPFDEIPSKGK